MHAQERFFSRVDRIGFYAPDPKIQALDLDDPNMAREYRRNPTAFTRKLKATNIDINSVLVRPDPSTIRMLALQEGNPATRWTLYLLTGPDTAQQLDDGIHLRRRGFDEKIVGHPVSENDLSGFAEASSVLWRPDGRGGWRVDEAGANYLFNISRSVIYETRRVRSSQVGQASDEIRPEFSLDCTALRQFAFPLDAGETTRQIVLDVNIPLNAEWRPSPMPPTYSPPCSIDLTRAPAIARPVRVERPSTVSSPVAAPGVAPASPSAPGEPIVVDLDPRRMWTPAGIEVAEGDALRISATGRVNGTTAPRDAAFRWVGPSGWGIEPPFVARNYHLLLGHGSSFMCLVVRVGSGKPYNAGFAPVAKFHVSGSGPLQLSVNDAVAQDDPEKYFKDNAGSFRVLITVTKAAGK